ncbi:MAG: hypothetical protein VB858_06045, partial [Planctomycetaceae bacterium]
DRVFSYYDRDKNGKLDGGEYERFSSELKEAVRAVRLDFRRGVDQATFIRAWPKLTGEMRARRDREASRRDDGRRDDDRRGDDRRDDGRRVEKPKFKRPPKRSPRPRITIDLPTKFSEADRNRDGQIGLYEWDRAKYREFFALDRNGDGLLTPRELTSQTGAAPASKSSRTVAARRTETPAKDTGKSGSKDKATTITAVEFDPESSDGRRASYVFRSLDRDKDGSLTKAEWERSQSTRRDFEKKNVTPPLPATLEQFAGLYIAVRKAR